MLFTRIKGMLPYVLYVAGALTASAQTYRVGSKNFNESYILGELFAQTLEHEGYTVERVFNLGGTAVCYEALRKGAIDLYPEYTGTLEKETLKADQPMTFAQLNARLQSVFGLEMGPSLGFENNYALCVTRATAERYGLATLSDLHKAPRLVAAFTHEFLERKDGWPALRNAYGLRLAPSGIEHGLAYSALADGKIDVTDAYSTDGEIKKYHLATLKDNLGFFPSYKAVPLFRAALDPAAKAVLSRLGGVLTAERMQAMNAEVLFDKKSPAQAARSFLRSLKKGGERPAVARRSRVAEIGEKVMTHIQLTAIAVGLATAVGLALGVMLYLLASLSKPVLYAAGLLQTIPSIALLALMIPLMGIGRTPAVAALCLYALLPILRNSVTGLNGVDPILKKVARGMGMTRLQQLWHVDLPLAMPAILAGIRTATVITIGTATLAAFIGAGGLGSFIVTGLALNNTELILQGAIPAALLAVVTELLFEVVERWLTPRHLKP